MSLVLPLSENRTMDLLLQNLFTKVILTVDIECYKSIAFEQTGFQYNIPSLDDKFCLVTKPQTITKVLLSALTSNKIQMAYLPTPGYKGALANTNTAYLESDTLPIDRYQLKAAQDQQLIHSIARSVYIEKLFTHWVQFYDTRQTQLNTRC